MISCKTSLDLPPLSSLEILSELGMALTLSPNEPSQNIRAHEQLQGPDIGRFVVGAKLIIWCSVNVMKTIYVNIVFKINFFVRKLSNIYLFFKKCMNVFSSRKLFTIRLSFKKSLTFPFRSALHRFLINIETGGRSFLSIFYSITFPSIYIMFVKHFFKH